MVSPNYSEYKKQRRTERVMEPHQQHRSFAQHPKTYNNHRHVDQPSPSPSSHTTDDHEDGNFHGYDDDFFDNHCYEDNNTPEERVVDVIESNGSSDYSMDYIDNKGEEVDFLQDEEFEGEDDELSRSREVLADDDELSTMSEEEEARILSGQKRKSECSQHHNLTLLIYSRIFHEHTIKIRYYYQFILFYFFYCYSLFIDTKRDGEYCTIVHI